MCHLESPSLVSGGEICSAAASREPEASNLPLNSFAAPRRAAALILIPLLLLLLLNAER
jgi:hypothetical protein